MQKKNSFDSETIKKILKGAGIAAVGAGAVGFIQALGNADLSQVCNESSMWICNQFLLPFVAWAVPTATNAVKEWMKGE